MLTITFLGDKIFMVSISGKNHLANFLFFSAYFLMIFMNIVSSSMLPQINGANVILYTISLLLISKILFIDDFKFYKFIIIFLILVFALITEHTSKSTDFMFLVMFILGSYKINIHKIFKFSFLFNSLFLGIIILLSYIKVIPNLVYFRSGTFRQALGTSYPAVLSGIVFFTIVSMVCYNINIKKKFEILEFIIIIILSVLMYKLTDTRTDLICSFLLIFPLFWKHYYKIFLNRIFKLILAFVPTYIFSWTMFSTYFYDSSSAIWENLNSLFSDRLYLNNYASLLYPAKWFGQFFVQIGNGSTTNSISNYFFIDSSFSRVYFMNGILAFIFFFCVLQYMFIKLIMENNILYNVLLVMFSITMVEGLFTPMFINIALNSLLFLISIVFFKKNKLDKINLIATKREGFFNER